MKRRLKKLTQKASNDAPKDGAAPRITNETVAAHREEVLSSARKYIYPLQHSKHKIVTITTGIIITAVVGFMSYSLIALYRLNSTTPFLYRVTQVVPLPVAKAGPSFVAYENYLFELRHYMYFYQNQQKLDFKTTAGKQQLEQYKKRALATVINAAYIKQLAKQNKLAVSDQEVNDEISILRLQNRLGGSEQAYEDALRQNFGWSVADFKRVIKQQLLEQKVVSAMDTTAHNTANTALAALSTGTSFSDTAAKYSDDLATKGSGGDLGLVGQSDRDLSPQAVSALFALKPGQISGIVNTGTSLVILKNIEASGDKIHAAQVTVTFKDISVFVNDLKAKHAARAFIKP
jgi:hypothetical protein